jgi:hypothetical protein
MALPRTTGRILAAALMACLYCYGSAEAKGPPKPPEGQSELIYFAFDGDTLQMKPDGNGKIGLDLGYQGAHFEPSYAAHGGTRWFLHGAPRNVTATNEDGTTVNLFTTPPPDAQGNYWRVNHDGNVRWIFDGVNEDGAVSWHYEFVRPRGDGTIEVLEEEVVRASIIYDTETGDVSGLDLDSIERFPEIAKYYDWSPDGNIIVFNDQGVLWIFDTEAQSGDQAFSLLPVAQVYGSPVWAPDSLRIAYGIVDREVNVSRIETINLLDNSIIGIAVGRLQSPLDGIVVFYPRWSPDGSNLLYQLADARGYSDTTHVIKKSANGKGKATNLTADLNVGITRRPWIYGWRKE